MDIETKICSAFSPKEKLSQKESSTNTVLMHSKDVCNKVQQIYKVAHNLQKYAPLWLNPSFCIGKQSIWHLNSISILGDLFKDGQFKTFD